MTPASDRTPNVYDNVVACTLRGRRTSDAIEIVLTETEISVAVLDVRAARDQEELRLALALRAREALVGHQPFHLLATELHRMVCKAVAASVGLAALRISHAEAKVELMNAGMPPVACALPDGRLLHLPPLSGDIGPRSQKAHPYELIPLARGSIWFVTTDGATGGSLEYSGELWSALGLPASAADLAQETSDGLSGRLNAGLGGLGMPEDASLVVVPTRREPRHQSGFE
ncbi:MAG TPA: SpoIIE family protein phosphatase [Polyangiaceae bacterium]